MEPCIRYLEAKSIEEQTGPGDRRSVTQARPRPVVKEWGLSHTTLEDVFLEVTKREHFVYPVPI